MCTLPFHSPPCPQVSKRERLWVIKGDNSSPHTSELRELPSERWGIGL